jgi:hypothetical protein
MPLPRNARFAVVLALGLGAGCADRFYERTLVAPPEPKAQACLDRCTLQTDECRARQNTREQECQAHYTAAMADYDLCTSSGAAPCVKPDTCLGADMSICEQVYDICFTDCGGRVEKHLRSRPWEAPQEAPSEAPTPANADAQG